MDNMYIVRWTEVEDWGDYEHYWKDNQEAVVIGEENAKRLFEDVQHREFYQEGSAELVKATVNEHGIVVPIE